jgi:hypothetical protein
MQPSRQHCLWASLALLFCLPAPRAFADSYTVTSTPPGATVEIDGNVVGKTPYRANVPSGYFHKTHTVFGSRLDHAMILRISLEGYAIEQLSMTEGPYEWIAVTGRHEGTYFLLKSNKFNVNLAAPSQSSTRSIIEPNGRAGPLPPAATAFSSDAGTQDDAETASVLITSETEGAEIYADGNFVGQTPSTIRLAAGAHRIEVRAQGKQSWVRSLDVIKESKITLRATFAQSDDPDSANKK